MKRIIYTLIYENGSFIQSRNFRRQRVGDINWLLNNYDFPKVGRFLDELTIINISSDNHDHSEFYSALSRISKSCFVPLTVGGKISSIDDASRYYEHGADKIFVNSLLTNDMKEITKIRKVYGSQAIVGGVNYTIENERVVFADSCGKPNVEISISAHCDYLVELGIGEVVFQAIHRDGTGFGVDLRILELLPKDFPLPVILMGGIGKAAHIVETLKEKRVDAVATANLLNFVGDSFLHVREAAISNNISVPKFNMEITF